MQKISSVASRCPKDNKMLLIKFVKRRVSVSKIIIPIAIYSVKQCL